MVGASPWSRGSVRAVPVEVHALSHEFMIKGAPLPVLAELSFTVGAGAFVSLLGPSGCGKSTLLRLAAGLERPTSGVIRVGGQQVDGPDPARALVFQDPTLYPWRTVWRNVALGLEARGMLRKDDQRVHDVLERVGLTAFARAHPHQLSGGMAQRAALARVLVNEPSLLLLDEPLGQLDALTRVTMQRELLRLWEAAGFTALLVTHDVDEALYLADRVLVLSARPGRVIGEVQVDVPRPRHHADPRLQGLRAEVLTLLGFDWT
jgi:NitT/TauT family transport system ATP-binding protein